MQHAFLNEYQRQVAAGLHLDHGHDPISHCALGLTGEAGEVADLIKKSQYMGGTLDEVELKRELGDVLWYLTALAHRMGWTLSDIIRWNIAKLEARGRMDCYSLDKLRATEVFG